MMMSMPGSLASVSTRPTFANVIYVLCTSLLMWVASSMGSIPLPGTPVPITLQTFVLMMAGLYLSWREAGSALTVYLGAGFLGLPVFANGGSTLSLLGPSAGFLIGFLPAVMVTAWLKEKMTRRRHRHLPLSAIYALAGSAGCILVVYGCGFCLQSLVTGLPLSDIVEVSAWFLVADLVKVLIAAVTAAGLRGCIDKSHRRKSSDFGGTV